MSDRLLSLFGTVGRGYAMCIPLLLVACCGLFLVLFPEIASKSIVRRRGLENDPGAAARVRRRCRIAGAILVGAAFLALAAVVVLIWTDRLQ